MGRKLLNLRDGVFEVSAVEPAQYPRDTGPPLPEIALVGRSNVGTSSLLNSLANRRDLAKTSSRPGRTQTINSCLEFPHGGSTRLRLRRSL